VDIHSKTVTVNRGYIAQTKFLGFIPLSRNIKLKLSKFSYKLYGPVLKHLDSEHRRKISA